MVQVAFVIGDEATVIDFAGPWEVFQDSMASSATEGFEMFTVSDHRRPVRATAGLIVVPQYAYDDPHMPQPNVIVIDAQAEHTPAKIDWIRWASAEANVAMWFAPEPFFWRRLGCSMACAPRRITTITINVRRSFHA